MPAFTLQATGTGTYDAWTLVGGGTKAGAMADSDDGTYCSIGAVGRQSFVFGNLPSEALSIIGPVTFNIRGKDVTATVDLCYMHARYGGVNDESQSINWTASIVSTTRDYATFNGGTWTPAIVNGAEYTMIVYKLYMTGLYGVGGGSYGYLIASLIGGMLGTGLSMADMPGIARAVAENPRPYEGISIIQPHEYAQALAELKAHPYRAWSL